MEGQIELEDYLRSLNCEGFDICDYIPKGRANAITRYELCMKTGFRDRQVRDLIHYARRDGSILNLSDGKGYFRPDLDDPVERGMLAAYVRQEESRRDSIDWSLNGAIKDCKEKIGAKTRILGNVDPGTIMYMGTRDQVRLETLKGIRDGYDSPKGYTPMSGCSLPVDTSFENIQEMMDTVTDVGYPVRIERVEELIEEVEKRMA